MTRRENDVARGGLGPIRRSSDLNDVLAHVERALQTFWRDKGFGEITIVSERNDREGFRVFVRVTTSERMIVHERDAVR